MPKGHFEMQQQKQLLAHLFVQQDNRGKIFGVFAQEIRRAVIIGRVCEFNRKLG